MENDNDTCSKKRRRDDHGDSPESGLHPAGVDPSVQDVNSSDLDDVKVDTDESSPDVPEAKRAHVDLLSILDDSDEPAIQGLDSVIRSFEEEILFHSCPASVDSAEVTSVGYCSQPDLGYLLEASDDELGLPPTFSAEEEKVNRADLCSETSGSAADCFGDILGFEGPIPAYDSFDFDLTDGPVSPCYNDTGDFVNLGGLFNFSDDKFVPGEISGVEWRRESLSAL